VIDRRSFLGALVAGLIALPRAGRAQQPRRIWRIGYLVPTREAPTAPVIRALGEVGYVDGQNVTLVVRTAADDFARLPTLAAELAQAKVDIILAVAPPAIRAAGQATKTIPIVMAYWGGPDLIESGTIVSFARPGTNVTGVYMLASELEGKRLELLIEAVPSARRMAMLNPGSAQGERLDELRSVAAAGHIDLSVSAIPASKDYLPVFEEMARDRIEAVLVPSFPRFYVERREIIEAAARYHLPAIYEWGDMARDGGLLAYGPDSLELNRLVARYVDRILKGASPRDLPVAQPTKFELVVNLRTARALNLVIPQSVLLRADEVIP